MLDPRGRAPRPSRAVRGHRRRGHPRTVRRQPSKQGEFFKAHALQALAIETAEGCAEWLHRRIREDWGFPDPPTMTMHERFTSRYRGKRYSFGYPACPNLDDQAGHLETAAAGRDRRVLDRGHDDGARGQRQRAGLPSPRLRVLHRQRNGGVGYFISIRMTCCSVVPMLRASCVTGSAHFTSPLLVWLRATLPSGKVLVSLS